MNVHWKPLLLLVIGVTVLGCAHLPEPEGGTAPASAEGGNDVLIEDPAPPMLASYTEPERSEEPAVEEEIADELADEPALDDTVPRHWPVDHEDRHVISEYGPRSSGFHKGIDIKAPLGTPVIAAASGTVEESGYGRGYGQYVLIKHSPEFSTLYGHLKSRLVEVGQKVQWGETIGLLGASGNASTHHVHFEVIWNGEHADPAFFLPAWEFIPGYEGSE